MTDTAAAPLASEDFSSAEQAQIDARWMAAALSLARRGLGRTAPNPAVGAIVIAPGAGEGRVVGRGWTQPGGRPHAETVALAAADKAARGATLYVTLEPCSHFGKTPPCVDAILAAGIARVVVATGDPDPRVDGSGLARLREAGVEAVDGVMATEARRLNIGHVTRVTLGRPHVALKLAVSRDGKVAGAGGKPVAITGEAARARVHLMRAEADAILVGVGTVLADDPELTCRLSGMAKRSPIRVVLDGKLRTPPSAKIVRSARETPTWIIAAADASVGAERALRDNGVEVLRVEREERGRLRLDQTFALLGARGVTRLMVEGGPTVAAALLAEEFVDNAVVLTGPVRLGPAAMDGLAAGALTQQAGLAETSRETVGQDIWTTYRLARPRRV